MCGCCSWALLNEDTQEEEFGTMIWLTYQGLEFKAMGQGLSGQKNPHTVNIQKYSAPNNTASINVCTYPTILLYVQ